MKIKRVIALLGLFMMMSFTTVFAKPTESNLFLGEIVEVRMDSKQENTMLLVKGYLKSCEVFEQELVAIISKDTVIMAGCDEQTKELKFEKGDKVFIELSPRMTFSIPPQSPALKIQVTKPVEN
ncbi:hypothetical protein [Clostridium sp.]|uniref:hypothetical protein n=1 Tax=Clostridium sp. TaxID=1506 RepID=UPI002FCA1C1D